MSMLFNVEPMLIMTSSLKLYDELTAVVIMQVLCYLYHVIHERVEGKDIYPTEY